MVFGALKVTENSLDGMEVCGVGTVVELRKECDGEGQIRSCRSKQVHERANNRLVCCDVNHLSLSIVIQTLVSVDRSQDRVAI